MASKKSAKTGAKGAARFGSDYYRRFYLTPATRAMSRAETEQRGSLIAAAVKQLDVPVRRILDAGCGLGWFRKPLLRAFPQATYTGIEFSEYLCRTHGWTQVSVVDYRSRHPFDLVICCDVLQYLDDRAAAKAIANLARLARGAVYLHVPTEEDFHERMDPSGTDQNVHLRSGAWYRRHLDKHFVHAGFGLLVKRDVPFAQWDLEQTFS
ncbi:MAG: class I SAM-dependent methyltransferase [Steroidobacteraceae bacterium]